MVKTIAKFLVIIFLTSCTNFVEDVPEKEVEKIYFETIAIQANYKKEPSLKSKWSKNRIPDVILCDNLLTVREANKNLDFWRRLGYQFGEVRTGDTYGDCMHSETMRGSIRISLPDSDQFHLLHDRLAVTHTTKFKYTGEIISVDIIIHEFAVDKKLTLEHEIGHALGWDHIRVEGHIMHPEWKHLGTDTKGVKIDDYRKKSSKVSVPK